MGGISARPELPHAPKLIENLSHYSSLANQTYPLNVRLELPLGTVCVAPYVSMSFADGQKLYQRVKNAFAISTILLLFRSRSEGLNS